MPSTVYIETTVVSYLTAWPSRDIIRAAQQEITREWWEEQRPRFDLRTSKLVWLEAAEGDPEAAEQRLVVLRQLTLLQVPAEAQELAEHLLASSALPSVASRDALHVAIAATNGIEYLLTWNCRHLANVTLRAKIEEVCDQAGFRPPLICTPEELSGDLS